MRKLELSLKRGEVLDTLTNYLKQADVLSFDIIQTDQHNRCMVNLYVRDFLNQDMIDTLHTIMEGETDWRLSVMPVEATLPHLPKRQSETDKKRKENNTREEIYADMNSAAEFSSDFIWMVVLSTIVAAIGLNTDSVAVVIGAMVIAPFLGPILAFSLGTNLGDMILIRQSALTLGAGFGASLVCSIGLAFIFDINTGSHELMVRTIVRIDFIALAVASGAAAALSALKGTSSSIVGVMVAAALLPPIAATGLFIGAQEFIFAGRVLMLLALNVACLVLAATCVFYMRKITPRNWYNKESASITTWVSVGSTTAILIFIIVALIFGDFPKELNPGGTS